MPSRTTTLLVGLAIVVGGVVLALYGTALTTYTCLSVEGAASSCGPSPMDTYLFVVLVGGGVLAAAFGGRTVWRAW